MDKYAEDIKKMPGQFAWRPTVENAGELAAGARFSRFVVGGMGGSHLAADFLKSAYPALDLKIHEDYGLPILPDGDSERLYIAVSYSGNTVETLDFARSTLENGLSLAVISKGGKLETFAKDNGLPHIVLPDWGIEPRMATGLMAMALLVFFGDHEKSQVFENIAKSADMTLAEKIGREAADFFKGSIPLIYASSRNTFAAKFMKIAMNETGKTAAFWNVFSELNHNEMMSFTGGADRFRIMYMTDEEDGPQIKKRMEVMQRLVKDRGGEVMGVALDGKSHYEKLANSIYLSHWTAYFTAKASGQDPASTALVEEFKKLIVP
ncbi:MAG: hypothetical protein KGI49_00250 [Patescibacteria group bacterium]|nr:hypothetical protein [Patescibacteria group bacterium]